MEMKTSIKQNDIVTAKKAIRHFLWENDLAEEGITLTLKGMESGESLPPVISKRSIVLNVNNAGNGLSEEQWFRLMEQEYEKLTHGRKRTVFDRVVKKIFVDHKYLTTFILGFLDIILILWIVFLLF